MSKSGAGDLNLVPLPSKTRQVEEVAVAVEELSVCYPDLSLARFYDFSIQRTLALYQQEPEELKRELSKYLTCQADEDP